MGTGKSNRKSIESQSFLCEIKMWFTFWWCFNAAVELYVRGDSNSQRLVMGVELQLAVGFGEFVMNLVQSLQLRHI